MNTVLLICINKHDYHLGQISNTDETPNTFLCQPIKQQMQKYKNQNLSKQQDINDWEYCMLSFG